MRASCRGFNAVCSNDAARKYFTDKGLTYASVTEGDVLVLVMMLNQEIKKANQIGETSVNTIHLSKRIDLKMNSNGTLISCFLYVNSNYFKQREAISFNQNGFIGFAGWADQGNTNPILRAFLRWCDYLDENGQSERDEVNE